MWNLEKALLITNNDKVYEKYKNVLQCILVEKYEEVLVKVRDFVYDRHILLTHPQASSLKPNQTPYRSVMVYPKGEKEDNTKDILLIEKCMETFRQWQDIACTPEDYRKKVAEDFKTIDLSVIDNIIPRII
ncbi:MAG: GrdX family protein [Leptotrichiaceae bacterium]|nr:GrdX family protein [Leptotrichiaceae bacterium]